MRMPPQRVLLGAGGIEAFLRGLRDGGHLAEIALAPTRANGRPGVIMNRPGGPHGVLLLDVEGDRIAALDTFLDTALVRRYEAAHWPSRVAWEAVAQAGTDAVGH